MPSEPGHFYAHRGPIGKGLGCHVPSPMLSSVDLVTCFRLLALTGADLMALHPFCS